MSANDGNVGSGGSAGPGGASGVIGSTATHAASGVAAKITHVKTSNIDATGIAGNTISINSTSLTTAAGATLMAGGAIKVATGAVTNTSLSGTSLGLSNVQSTTSASIRAIGAGGQSTQVRVVMPTGIMQQSMIKQLENATVSGRTQITAISAQPTRSVSNASITVTRPVTQAAYLPRAGVTATQMTGVGVAAGQRLVTPLRSTATASVTPTASGLTTAGTFVRGTAVSRSTVPTPSTVISSASNTTWMTANSSTVQLIRTIPHQSRQRIITAQGINAAANTGLPGLNAGNQVVSVGGSVMTTTTTPVTVPSGAGSTIQTIGATQSATHPQQPQQAYVAVLPPRQHQATLVYSSNMGASPTSQPLSQGQSFNPTVSTSQRFAVAAPLTASTTVTPTVAAANTTTRQIRPIPIGKSFSTAKLNTTSISIRTPSIPQLTSTMASGGMTTVAPAVTGASAVVCAQGRNSTTTGVSAAVSNLPATRIIQLQQPATGTAQQLISSTGRFSGNVVLQPIVVNTSSGGKIGIRPPVTMTAKVQPSLTITQLNTIGKLPATATVTAQNVSTSIQTIGGNSGNASPSIGGPSSGNNTTNATTHVNVSQASQLLAASGVVSSVAGTAGGATVVPLAISTRSGSGNNILTGTITPIKTGNAITVGKMMTQTTTGSLEANQVAAAQQTGGAPTSVFIHQRPISNNNSGALNSSTGISVSVSNAAVTSSGSAFLPAGSTIYYESMPANSVQVSTGVLSLTTTTVTQSTLPQVQMAGSTAGLAISSLPFVTHSGGSTTTFTVVPTSAGGRTIGQLQLPVTNTGAQLQAVRLSGAQTSGNASTELSTTAQLVQTGTGQQLISLPATQTSNQQSAPQHMVIPLQTSVKVTSGAGNITSGGGGSGGGINNNSSNSMPITAIPSATTVVSNFLRKRDADGSPIRAAKNLGPTLLSMSAVTIAGTVSSISNSSYSLNSSTSTVATAVVATTAIGMTSALTTEALSKKERAAAAAANNNKNSGALNARGTRADSPASSDGSTTVSANSSPGVDKQMQDSNMIVVNRMTERNSGNSNNATHFNPINDLYPNHHATLSISNNMHPAAISSRIGCNNMEQHHGQQPHMHVNMTLNTAQRLNGGANLENTSRKKDRRSTNDSQNSLQSQASLSLPPPTANVPVTINMSNISTQPEVYFQNGLLTTEVPAADAVLVTNNLQRVNNLSATVPANKENAKPTDFILRRPRNFSLLNAYKMPHRLAYNHFQRHTDVKPREERRPSVMDLVNQDNVMGKINGWRIYHLRSQMEDMVENETASYNKMECMLQQLEKNDDKNPDIERINELLKGNMQRSKIVVDGINEAQNQIMKVFEHKSHISDIINRCASKRNFKKREKF